MDKKKIYITLQNNSVFFYQVETSIYIIKAPYVFLHSLI